MRLGLGLGLGSQKLAGQIGGVPLPSPTAIFLSDLEVAEDATNGTLIGTLLTAGGTAPYTYALTINPSTKLAIDGDSLEVNGSFSGLTDFTFTVQTTDANAQTFSQEFTLTVVEAIDNGSGIGEGDGEVVIPDPEDPETDEGGYEEPPIQQDTSAGLKIHGKNGGSATFLKDWGPPLPGAIYTMRYSVDWSLMSRLGREAAIGFAFKNGNDFHLTSLRGNGLSPTTTMLESKVYGDFRKANQFTITNDGSAANGTKDGPNWLQIEIAEDGTTYTLRTSADGSSWADAYTDAVPTPLTNSDDALQFGPGGYFTNTDKGIFSITIEEFSEVVLANPVTYIGHYSQSFSPSPGDVTWDDAPIATTDADDVVVVGVLAGAPFGLTTSGLTVGGQAATRWSPGSHLMSFIWAGYIEFYICKPGVLSVADIVFSISAGSSAEADLYAWVLRGMSDTPVDEVTLAGASNTAGVIPNIAKVADGAILALGAFAPGTTGNYSSEAWTGAEAVSEDGEFASLSGNHRSVACSIETTSASTTDDLTLNISESKMNFAGAISFGPLALGFYALVQKSGGDQTISGTEQAVTWEADVSDDQNVHDPSSDNTRFTIPAAWNGRYCRMTYSLLTTGTPGEIYAYLMKDGLATFPGYARLDASTTSGVEAGNSMSAPFVVATGEYYQVFADDATTYDDADNTWGQIEMLPSDFNGAHITKSSNQALSAGTNTDITWATEVYDLGGWFNVGTSAIDLTVPVGVSLVRVSAQFLNETATGQAFGFIHRNGAAEHGLPQADHDTTGRDSVNLVSAPIAVSAGDDFKVIGFHTSAVDILADNATWFAIEELPSDLKYALVRRSSSQSIAGSSFVTVDWNDEVADTDAWHDNSTNPSRLTVPIGSGITHVRLFANVLTGNSNSGQWGAYILKNGTTVVGCPRHETNTNGTDSVNIKSAILEVVEGDYFELVVFTGSASATSITNAAQSWMSIEEVRDAS